MINKITAAIDIGSYNCRMIIVNNAPKIKVLKTISVPTNLIKNLSYSNEFTHENIKKTVNCLTMFSRKMLEVLNRIRKSIKFSRILSNELQVF